MSAYDPSIKQQLRIMVDTSESQLAFLRKLEQSMRVCTADAARCPKCSACAERRELSEKIARMMATNRHLMIEHCKAGAEASAMMCAHRTRKVDEYRQRFATLRQRYEVLLRTGDSFYGHLAALERRRSALVAVAPALGEK